MKKKLTYLMVLIGFFSTVMNSSLSEANASNTGKLQPNQPIIYGSLAAKQDSSLTLSDMLTYGLQDEYWARAKYDAIQSKFGVNRPFSQIKRAEERHISALLPLFKKYKVPIPKDESAKFVVIPRTLKEAFAMGVQGEIESIAMYNRFLAQTLPQDVRLVFTQLRDASKNHLRAFQRGLATFQ